jgi:hypothetical protein
MSFEKCTEIMTKCFNTLHKDVDQRFSDRQKVEKLLTAIRCQDAELLAAKAVIDQQYPRDFIGACGYFSQQVARIHGSAQLEYKQSRNKKRGVYAIDIAEVAAVERVAVLVVVVIEARVEITPEEVALVAEHKLLLTAST